MVHPYPKARSIVRFRRSRPSYEGCISPDSLHPTTDCDPSNTFSFSTETWRFLTFPVYLVSSRAPPTTTVSLNHHLRPIFPNQNIGDFSSLA